jgi:hypothetical protein
MVTDHQPNYRALVACVFILAVMITVARLFITWFFSSGSSTPISGFQATFLDFVIAGIGGTTLAGFLVDSYARRLWTCKWPPFSWLKNWLGLPPDINGWWKGHYQRYDLW